MENPSTEHQLAVKKIMRYLNGTVDMGMMYNKGGNNQLLAYIY